MIKNSDFGISQDDYQSIQAIFDSYSNVTEVIIYGSRAIGKYRDNSDVDLTLIGPNLNLDTLMQISDDIDSLMLPYKFDLSIKAHLDHPNLIKHIDNVGISFYKR